MAHKYCTAAAPMPLADAKLHYWTHEGAEYQRRFFNLAIYKCPHCGFHFATHPRESDRAKWETEKPRNG